MKKLITILMALSIVGAVMTGCAKAEEAPATTTETPAEGAK